MKKLSFQKTTALKGLLLAALAANISWEPTFKSLSLSSSELLTNVQDRQETAPQAKSDVKPDAARASSEGPRTDKAVRAQEPEIEVRQESPKICDERWLVTYRQTKPVKGEVFTEIWVERQMTSSNGVPTLKYQLKGGFDTNIDKKEVKKEIRDVIVRDLKKKIDDCQTVAKIDTDKEVIKEEKKTEKKEVRKESDKDDEKILAETDKKRLEKGVKECRIDRKGNPLTEIQQTRCRLDQIDQIAERSEGRGTSEAMKIKALINGSLKNTIKKRLKSKDPLDVAEGEELIEDAIDRIQSADIDPRQAERLVSSLEAMKAGGETYRQSLALDQEVKEAKNQLRADSLEAMAALRANPNDIYARQRLIDIQGQQMMLQQNFRQRASMDIMNGPYRNLSMRRNDLGMGDYNDFVQPYNMLMTDINAMMDLNRGTGLSINPSMPQPNSYTPPTDFMRYRSGLQSLNPSQPLYNNAPMAPNAVGNPPANMVGGRRF